MKADYILGEAATNLRRNVLLALGAVLAVFISLLLAYFALIVGQVAHNSTRLWEEDVEIIAFLHDAPTGTQIALQDEIRTWPEVKEVSYFTKAEAYEEFKRMFAGEPRFVAETDPAALPASYRLYLNDPDSYQIVADRLARLEGVRRVTLPRELVEDLLGFSRVINIIVIALALALGISAIVLISNTVRMAIYARREEIGIMKLVGASNWFVRIPFLVEGMIEGLVGGILAVVVGWFGYEFLLRNVGNVFEWANTELATDFLLSRGLLILAVGGITGAVGSLVGLSRYLRT